MLRAEWSEQGINVSDFKRSKLSPGYVRLQVQACGICGSDLHIYRRHFGKRPSYTPGHEFVGTIIDGGARLEDGLYAVEPHIPCSGCEFCISGKRHLCRRGILIGMRAPGGLAEIADVPRSVIYPVASSVQPLAASFAEPMSVCVRALHLARPDVDSRVLVLGAGTIGLLTGLLARDRVGLVGITARYPHQRLVAEGFGITPLAEDEVDQWVAEYNPDIVIETVGGEASTLKQAIQGCRHGGRIVVLGVFRDPQQVDVLALLTKELTLMGSVVYGMGRRGSEFGAGVSLLSRYQEELKPLQTHQFMLRNVQEAFRTADDKQSGAIKVTIIPNETR